jgi:hypothetical protein
MDLQEWWFFYGRNPVIAAFILSKPIEEAHMTIKLINDNLPENTFKESQRYLIERLGRKVEFIIPSKSTNFETVAFEDETLVFESPDTVKIYSRAYGYRRMSLQSFITQKEALLGISIH